MKILSLAFVSYISNVAIKQHRAETEKHSGTLHGDPVLYFLANSSPELFMKNSNTPFPLGDMKMQSAYKQSTQNARLPKLFSKKNTILMAAFLAAMDSVVAREAFTQSSNFGGTIAVHRSVGSAVKQSGRPSVVPGNSTSCTDVGVIEEHVDIAKDPRDTAGHIGPANPDSSAPCTAAQEKIEVDNEEDDSHVEFAFVRAAEERVRLGHVEYSFSRRSNNNEDGQHPHPHQGWSPTAPGWITEA